MLMRSSVNVLYQYCYETFVVLRLLLTLEDDDDLKCMSFPASPTSLLCVTFEGWLLDDNDMVI